MLGEGYDIALEHVLTLGTRSGAAYRQKSLTQESFGSGERRILSSACSATFPRQVPREGIEPSICAHAGQPPS